ncbi:MAG TPA: GspE/PulE family protein [Candidatus Paceibacterota bacterium]|nr:GspE/PulE family protein [Candidatus Paceibacterota bacterium]
MPTFDDTQSLKKLEETKIREAEDLAQILSGKYGIPYLDLSTVSINTDALRLIEESVAKEAKIAGFQMTGKKVSILVFSPNNPALDEALNDLKERGYSPVLYMGSERSLERAWGRYKEISQAVETKAGLVDISPELLAEVLAKTKAVADVKNQIKELTAGNKSQGVSRILEIVIAGALATKASDIHLEPQEEFVRLRYRLDGMLHDVDFFDHNVYKLIVSRIKLISALKLNVKKSSQDGRFTIVAEDRDIEVRTSVLPGVYGETIVMRLLDPNSISVNLEDMGIEEKLLKVFLDEIKKPNGLILTTGPTGSGKTTTLYAFLRKVNDSETKIITIEDPVEYHMKGLSQTQVSEDSGYTFLEGLRSALRQDPDIIMVGEIRDPETAKIAINSALTGHLVFSTLHTNDAAGAIPRLVDLGVNPKIISSALTLTIAQRLVRKLCPECKKATTPKEEDAKMIENVSKLIKEKRPDIAVPDGKQVWVAGEGCEFCNGVGYKGRTGVFEAIIVDADVSRVITGEVNARDIKIASHKQGILDMREHGILKVLQGMTSIEELERVVELRLAEELY